MSKTKTPNLNKTLPVAYEPLASASIDRAWIEEDVLTHDEYFADAVRSTAKVLNYASEHALDITMIVSSLRERARGKFYEQNTGYSFAKQLEQILNKNKRIRILMWTDYQQGLIATEVVDLLERRGAIDPEPKEGEIEVRMTGMREEWKSVSHFICAHDKEWRNTTSSPAMLRIEVPHAPSDVEQVVSGDTKVASAILCEGRLAHKLKNVHLNKFEKYFAAVLDNSGHKPRPKVVPAKELAQYHHR